MSDGQMFHVLTFGQKNMPGYAAQISAADRWQAILHVRSLQDAAVRKAEADRKAQAAAAESTSGEPASSGTDNDQAEDQNDDQEESNP